MTPVQRRVLWTIIARTDLAEIVAWLDNENPPAARAALVRLRTFAGRLGTFPEQGRVVPELRKHGVELYRELIADPWRLIYRSDDRTVWVMAVIDGRRNLEDLLLERFIR